MEWVKLLSQKLRNQSLSEVNPIVPHSADPATLMDERPSDTESDEENAEICSITEGLDSTATTTKSNCNQENKPLSNVKITPQLPQLSQAAIASPCVVTSSVRRPFRQVQPFQQQQQFTAKTPETFIIAASKSTVMDYTDIERSHAGHERDLQSCSPDDFERHSSEDELTVINYINVHQACPEKRKWSQMLCIEGSSSNSNSSGSNSNTSGSTNNKHAQIAIDLPPPPRLSSNATSPASSDEEVRDVLFHSKPSNFSSSPPRGIQRLRRTISPRKFLANVSPTYSQSCWKSPRKRQRQNSFGDSTQQATVMQRPCLDLEKMQNSSTSRRHHHNHHHHSHHHHGVTRARIVKIKTFNGSGRPSKCVLDPAVFSFRSISTTYNQLTPVEEPCAF